jgi:5-methylcytosine-specific restriction endonuclease McrA
VKRLVARELTLSFVPDAEQRLWRTVTHKKYQLRCDHVRLQNQLESLLEEVHHMKRKSQLGGDVMQNLLILCAGCHAKCHGGVRR